MPLQAETIQFRKFVLPNGLTLIVHEDHGQPFAAISVWYHVGSRDETRGRTGFAHLFEHLMFNGSQHANGDWYKFMNAIGATQVNGTTAQDRTNFYETVPVGAIDRILWLESDRMGHLLEGIDQAKLDQQRGVVENEKRQRGNTPLGSIPEMISAGVYPSDHPYSWEPIGSIKDLDAASLDDVRNWFRTWYGAGNAVVVIAGDVDAAEMRAKVGKYFGFVPHGPALQRNEKWLATRTGERRASLQIAAPQGHLIKVWNVPAFGTADADRLDIAAATLGEGIDSRLYERLVNRDQSATAVGANNESRQLGGLFSVDVTIRQGIDPVSVEKALDEEMARFMRDGPTQAELERYKLGVHAAMVHMADQPGPMGHLLAENFLYTGDAGSYRSSLQRRYDATGTEVRAAAKTWLSDGAYVLSATPLLPAVSSADADRTALPPVGKPAPLSIRAPQRFTLSNGLNVQMVERHGAPTVAVQLIFKTGMQADRGAAPPSTGKMATALALKGSQKLSEIMIADQEKRLGSRVAWLSSTENMKYVMSALSANLGSSLDLYADLLIHPTFPEEAFKRQQTLAIASVLQARSTPNGKVGLTQLPLILGTGHPYAVLPTPETLAAMTTDELRDWYRRWVRPENATLLVIGDVTEAKLRPMLEQRFAEWRGQSAPVPALAPLPRVPASPKPRIFLIDQPGAEQSVVAIGDLTPNRSDPDFEAMSIVNGVVGGSFLSRLNQNLREDKHWAYGAESNFTAQQFFGMFSVSTSVQTDKTAASLHEIDRELRDLLSIRGLTATEIRQAKDADIFTLSRNLNSAESMANLYAEVIRFDLDDSFWNGHADRVEAMTPGQFERAAAKLVRPDEMTWIVVGDLAKIEASVRQLGLGSVEVIDANGKRIGGR